MTANGAAQCVFSVDVEEWFHILNVPATPPFNEWDALAPTVESSFGRMLDVFAEKKVRTTLFVLAWVARKYPQLVRRAADQGHEIASHGLRHELVYTISRDRFVEDITTARKMLQDVTGAAVKGYRAPGFSATHATPWFFEAVAQAGYSYDSSIWPGSRGHGGWPGALSTPYRIHTAAGDLVEFPISLARTLGRDVYFFGGGYLRFFPYPLIRSKAHEVLKEGRPVVFYLHPREIDPDHPRLPMSAKRRFMSYFNLRSTEPKMRRLFDDLSMVTFQELMHALDQQIPIRTA